ARGPRPPGATVSLETPTAAEATGPIAVRVSRRVTDDIPLTLLTRVELSVSGKNRELLLGRALPDGFVPLSLVTPLPARLEADGRLRLQIRPGTWVVELAARHDGPVKSLARPAPARPWTDGD